MQNSQTDDIHTDGHKTPWKVRVLSKTYISKIYPQNAQYAQ